jgi:hypothetical protein
MFDLVAISTFKMQIDRPMNTRKSLMYFQMLIDLKHLVSTWNLYYHICTDNIFFLFFL